MKQHLHTIARASERGMTLIEIMIVITIMGIVMTMVGVAVLNRLTDAKIDVTIDEMRNIENAVTMFKIKYNRVPTTSEGIDALIHPPAGPKGRTFPAFLQGDSVPTDEWDTPYQYFAPAQGCQADFEIRSLGANAADGGDGADDDLSTCND